VTVATLANPHLQLTFDSTLGRWSLFPRQSETPYLDQARFGATYHRRRGLPQRWNGIVRDTRLSSPADRASPHGPLTTLQIETGSLIDGPQITVEFALPEQGPFLLWRLIVRNTASEPLYLDSLDLLCLGPYFHREASRARTMLGLRDEATPGPVGALRLDASPGQLSFFSNGYQSWSFAGALSATQRYPGSLFGPLGDPKRINLSAPRPWRPGHFVSDMFGALGDTAHQIGLVVGFISQVEQFGVVEAKLDGFAPSLRLSAHCDGVQLGPGDSRATDWAYLQFINLEQADPLADYLDAAARENSARVPQRTPVGWCSWYLYFDKITEQDLSHNLDAIVRERATLPLDFVQLDDGFQAQVGDWFETKDTFPQGMHWVANQIRDHGHTPGVWLAPYIVRSDAKLVREHPDWFLKTPGGRRVNAGFNWYRWCFGLDPTHPEVRAHVRRLITTAAQEWGFPYLKLDFLYAAALPAKRYDPTLTRAQAMRLALSDMREAAGPDVFLLGCGCPLGSAIGLVDGMRIGTDVAPDWEPHLFHTSVAPVIKNELDYVSVRNAIRNTINRAPMHRRWWLNDPDCLLARDHDTRLNDAQVRSLATVIALSGGMFLVSDDMTRLHPERHFYIAPLLPVLNESARAPSWLSQTMPDVFALPLSGPTGEWRVVGVFNWEERPRDREMDWTALGLEPGVDYWLADFWERTQTQLVRDTALRLPAIPAHGAHLLAFRRVIPGPQFVASTFHFSQGAEVTQWRVAQNSLNFTLELGRVDVGEVRLQLPVIPHTVRVDQEATTAVELTHNLYGLRFPVNQRATIQVEW
jgi:alpha-galactosidase